MQTDADDATLVAQVLAGDRDAYGHIVRRYSRKVFGLAYRVTASESDAEEVVQETFLKAYKALARWEQRSSLSTWIYRIAMNTALDWKAKDRSHLSVTIGEDPEPESGEVQVASENPNQEQAMYGTQLGQKIQQAMGRLSRTERAAFMMRHMEGRSVEEISAVLGIKDNAAKNTIFRAVQKMRQALEPVVAR